MKDLLRFLKYALPYKWKLIGACVLLMLSGVIMLLILALVKPLTNEVLRVESRPGEEISASLPVENDPSASSSDEESAKRTVALPSEKDIMTMVEKYLPMEKIRTYTKERAFVEVPLFIFILFFIKVLFTYLGQYLVLNAGLRTLMDLKGDLYSSIQDQSLKFFTINPTGVIMARIMSDVERLSRVVSMHLADSILLIFYLIFIPILLFYSAWQLSIVCFVALPLAFYPIVKFGKRLKRASRKSQERIGEVATLLNEKISGIKVVKSFSMEEVEKVRFREALKRLFRVDRKIVKTLVLAPNVMELLGALVAALLFWWAGYLIHKESLSPGTFTMFLSGTMLVFLSVKKLNIVNNELQQAAAAATRVFKMMDTRSEIQERENAIQISSFHRDIIFRGVSFSYGEEEVLKDIHLSIKKGEVVALVGSSGAGKTTLVNLIPRFYDVTKGQVMIDGHDVRDLEIRSLREQIGIVSQETILFNDTVRNNIAYGCPDAPIEEIIKAAKAAHAHEFILNLPQDYDTILEERGERLSAGQRQRITIARALLKDPPILILDEATSALDTASEALVQKALKVLMEGRTSIVIAHRLSTVRRADCIYALDNCRIIEKGTHQDLLDMNGVYAKLHAIQFTED
jgi:subfamily B ATP-binding cassette protein MsbA